MIFFPQARHWCAHRALAFLNATLHVFEQKTSLRSPLPRRKNTSPHILHLNVRQASHNFVLGIGRSIADWHQRHFLGGTDGYGNLCLSQNRGCAFQKRLSVTVNIAQSGSLCKWNY